MRFSSVLLSKSIRDELAQMRSSAIEGKTLSDYFQWLFKNRDFTFKGMRKRMDEQRLEDIKRVNCFMDLDFVKLGPEVHAATYTVKLGGKFRLKDSSRWLGLEGNNKNLSDILPNERTKDFVVEGLDLSRSVIQTEGISNFENCMQLKTLVLRDCYFVNDWYLSRIAHIFSDKLEHLDLSGCRAISDHGLETLAYLSKLRSLNVAGLEGVANKEFLAILLEDHIPGLIVEGCDHLTDEALERTRKRLLPTNETDKEQKYVPQVR